MPSSLPGESKESFTSLAGCGMESMQLMFKNEMLINQSKANLDEKILFGKIIHLEVPKIRKMPAVRGLHGKGKLHIPFWSMIYSTHKFRLNTIVTFRNEFQQLVNHGPEWKGGFLFPNKPCSSNFLISGSK